MLKPAESGERSCLAAWPILSALQVLASSACRQGRKCRRSARPRAPARPSGRAAAKLGASAIVSLQYASRSPAGKQAPPIHFPTSSRGLVLLPWRNILFIYWGRRGAMSQFTLELARVAARIPGLNAKFSVSTGNELLDEITEAGNQVLPIESFKSNVGAVSSMGRVLRLKRMMRDTIERHEIDTVVVLMSHVWTPLVAEDIKKAGARLVVVVHDAYGHTGDPAGLVNRWLLRDAEKADVIITLSDHVRKALQNRLAVAPERLRTLFHPIYSYGHAVADGERPSPLRILFFGRILPYKGLGILVEAAERLVAAGRPLVLGVVGEGSLKGYEARLQRLGARVVNRWIAHAEVSRHFRSYDVVAAPYIEASQSGVISAAMGCGLPVVATPVGGLGEQIVDGVTGILAREATPSSFAEAIERLIVEPELIHRLRRGVAQASQNLSMCTFLRQLLETQIYGPARERSNVLPRTSEANCCG